VFILNKLHLLRLFFRQAETHGKTKLSDGQLDAVILLFSVGGLPHPALLIDLVKVQIG
jgi:hypothetical protein